MGIKGLLPLLKSIHKHCTLKAFAGQTIGVDAYGWLHRGVIGCAFALALDRPTTIHIDFVLSRVRMLLDFGVTPYLVFDGDNLPSKAATEDARRQRRDAAKKAGLELHRAGKTSQAQQELQKAVDVTPLMARQLIDELKKMNVPYVVAPYEADAQLVYLEQQGVIDGILSEDSDMLVFGARRLLTKLNQHGELIEVDRADFGRCKEINLAGWSDQMFRRMTILSGCDYLPNIGKMGLKTAHAYVRKHDDIEKILRLIQFQGKMVVPTNYLDDFRHAELTFIHHRVFCPRTQQMTFLHELPVGLSPQDMPFLGPHVDAPTAVGVARGDLDPSSKTPLRPGAKPPSLRTAMSEGRRTSQTVAPELKPKKSIDSFFKPHRQPLAELDPNSLTPSPSQQRLLALHRDRSWEPRLVSAGPRAHHSAPSSTPTGASALLARPSPQSKLQTPKRPRLCADFPGPSSVDALEQSPFFPVSRLETSLLGAQKTRSKPRKRSDFAIFSDDSSSVTPLDGTVQQRASPEMIGEPHASLPRAGDGDVQEVDAVPQSSPIGCPHSPLAAVEAIGEEEDVGGFEDLLDYHIRQQNATLLKTFRFQPGMMGVWNGRSPAASPPACTFSAQPPDVQRVALTTLSQPCDVSKTAHDVSSERTLSRPAPGARRRTLDSLATPVRGQPNEGDAEVSRASPQPIELRGSEDAMVPNSEDDGSEIGSPLPKSRFDLSSFAFASG